MSINLHFQPEDWERIKRDWRAWWAGELPRPLVVMETLSPDYRQPAPQGFTSN